MMMQLARARDRMAVGATAVWLAACAGKEPAEDRPRAAEGDAAAPQARSEPAAVPPAGGAPEQLVIQTELAALANARAVSAHGRPPVGFLELRPAVATPIIAREAPDVSSQKIATLDNAGIHVGGSRSCEWVYWWAADDEEGRARCGDVIEFEEEREGIPVYEASQGDGERWLRVIARADGANGWVRTAAPYHSIEDVLTDKDRLTYLNGHWDKKLYARPGKRPRRLRSARPENVYEAFGHEWVGDVLWLNVKVVSSLCDEDTVRTRGKGWVRAWDRTARLVAWFHSRGC
jgi:hypothetical protein